LTVSTISRFTSCSKPSRTLGWKMPRNCWRRWWMVSALRTSVTCRWTLPP